ncbi:transcription activator MSS11-like [Ctenocephalides felis]|nr:transcription activator MSS11-like [Ctenocephalides felis]
MREKMEEVKPKVEFLPNEQIVQSSEQNISIMTSQNQQNQQNTQQQQQPQVITLQQLQSFLPGGLNQLEASQVQAQAQTTPVKSFMTPQGQQVLQVQSMSPQFMQGGQILSSGAPNLAYSVMQPIQTVTVDGQEAIYIPVSMANAAQTIQIGGQQALLTPAGQIIRTPQGTVLPANLLQGMTAQTVQLPNAASNPAIITIPGTNIQIPLSGSQGIAFPGGNITIPGLNTSTNSGQQQQQNNTSGGGTTITIPGTNIQIQSPVQQNSQQSNNSSTANKDTAKLESSGQNVSVRSPMPQVVQFANAMAAQTIPVQVP